MRQLAEQAPKPITFQPIGWSEPGFLLADLTQGRSLKLINTRIYSGIIIPWGIQPQDIPGFPEANTGKHTLAVLHELVVEEYHLLDAYLRGSGGFLVSPRLLDAPAIQYLLEMGRELGMNGGIIVVDPCDLDVVTKTDAEFVVVSKADSPMDPIFCQKLSKLKRVNVLHMGQAYGLDDTQGLFQGFIATPSWFHINFLTEENTNAPS